MANSKNVHDPRCEGAVMNLIKKGDYEGTKVFNIEVIEPPSPGDCQSWAFGQLGLPQLSHGELSLKELRKAGFKETLNPQERDLIFYEKIVHYGIFHEGDRMAAKLGTGGAVCRHPLSAFVGTSTPKFYHRALQF